MSKLTKAELSQYKRLLSITRKDGSDEHFSDLENFEERMDKKYGSWSIIPVKKAKGGMMKKKGYAEGGAMKKKAYAKGGKVATYNVGGMIKSTGLINTGVKNAKNTSK